jgi:membrane protein DedA with SNARE-associated domain
MQALIEFLQLFWTNLQNGHLPELGYWNYFILSFLIVLNGPAATLLGGAAANAGLLRPHYVFLAGIIGNLIADIFWYNVGARGKTDWILKRGARLGVRQRHLDKLSEGMEQHVVKILLMAKISVGLAVPTLLVAGITRVPWEKVVPHRLHWRSHLDRVISPGRLFCNRSNQTSRTWHRSLLIGLHLLVFGHAGLAHPAHVTQ